MNVWMYLGFLVLANITAMLIGTMLFMTGFIAELINRNSSTRNEYLLKDKI